MQTKKFSVFGRIYHQSSHLDDEFPYGVRLYGGDGSLIHKEPVSRSIETQYGVEFRSPWRMDFWSMQLRRS